VEVLRGTVDPVRVEAAARGLHDAGLCWDGARLAGLTYREIGDRLFISAKTVEHHVARMRSRLDCANRAEQLALLRTILADRSNSAARQPWPERPPSGSRSREQREECR
jgi:hypothetical protein